ncbi:MAG: phosphoenolpyruvate carboxykinase (ATP) [Chitinophagales bacterium]|nr:phosphoenolpyruvate carboxykinase (ATP) [Chitinophagales bacterium]MDW8427067.1 phosphoenolpyruvate carboxykinase (ATP) [Chitinophagales bacterium]
MHELGTRNPAHSIAQYGIRGKHTAFWNLSPDQLIDRTVELGLGTLTSTGALAVDTGEFTGRAPKDKYIVRDAVTDSTVYWGEVNQPFEEKYFEPLLAELLEYLSNRDVYIKDAYACADPAYRLNVRVITELPWAALFVSNLFLRFAEDELLSATPHWVIFHAPGFKARPERYGLRAGNFAILNFSRRTILIGGTAYTGEIKKGIFTVLNYVLPQQRNILSMHCSANQGSQGDTAIFFGLSGTGKTTLSADPNRCLIGDDEHGWSDHGIFNFEGGCYAKCVNLSEEKEPQIFRAVRRGALLENVRFFAGTNQVNYDDISVTENTRVSYPLHYIENALIPSVGGHPRNIFFLTCDAFGVLPPIARLSTGQAMYWFLSGYTAKVAGTEAGITEPKVTFSTCFGAPFLPLDPNRYATMLADKLRKHQATVWLVNTGWTGGPYGVGSRMKLSYTRQMIAEALAGRLHEVPYKIHPVFRLHYPVRCAGVPDEVMDPRNTWADPLAYDVQADKLAIQFRRNFTKFEATASKEALAAAPQLMSAAT